MASEAINNTRIPPSAANLTGRLTSAAASAFDFAGGEFEKLAALAKKLGERYSGLFDVDVTRGKPGGENAKRLAAKTTLHAHPENPTKLNLGQAQLRTGTQPADKPGAAITACVPGLVLCYYLAPNKTFADLARRANQTTQARPQPSPEVTANV